MKRLAATPDYYKTTDKRMVEFARSDCVPQDSMNRKNRLAQAGHAAQACRALLVMLALFFTAPAAWAVDYVSVSESSAILYDAPSLKAKRLFVVNRYMPFEQIVTLGNWVKVRDNSGALYWMEKRVLSGKRYVFALTPLLDVRAAPDTGAARLFQVRQQVALEHLETMGNGWVKVRHQDRDTGYVRSVEVWGE